jgi:ribosomal protein S18 acetylase RimI-like enzyme
MVTAALAEELDAPVWAALSGPHSAFAEISGRARRYDPDVSAWCGVEALTPAAWQDLRELAGPGAVAVFFQRAPVSVPEGHEHLGDHRCVQMIAPPNLEGPAIDVGTVVELGADDFDEMAGLVADTRPGPFFPRTVELGGYVGVRVEGELVAMAGQRMRTPGACEISAVCTRDDHRGRGLAAALTARVARVITERGEVAFLHARTDNTAARRLYEHLGFETRSEIDVTVVKLPE